MSSVYDSRQRWKLGLILAAVLIAMVSVVTSDLLIKDLVREERQKIKVWSEATRVMIGKSLGLNMDLILKIIRGNTPIPAIPCSETDSMIFYNNIEIPEKSIAQFMTNKVKGLRVRSPPIVIDIESSTYQYSYYGDSIILERLLVYPYVQLSVAFVSILIAFSTLASTKKVEQNRMWVGLSKETACQLGTPISSPIAWVEYLRMKGIDSSLLAEMSKDVERLQTIVERFSKISSDPGPVPTSIMESIRAALEYMETHIFPKVKINTRLPERPILALMNDPLSAWIIENLTKNAVDAMEGQGEVSLEVKEGEKVVLIDLADTGKDTPKSKFKAISSPGHTTKKRGWGLDLSLVRRIIESFQGGKIFVESSELGKEITFRTKLEKYKD